MLALSFGDLAFSKLWAGREKDLVFVKGMCNIRHPDLENVMGYIEMMPPSELREKALNRWLHMSGLDYKPKKMHP